MTTSEKHGNGGAMILRYIVTTQKKKKNPFPGFTDSAARSNDNIGPLPSPSLALQTAMKDEDPYISGEEPKPYMVLQTK